jgi:hypothetical protein
VIHVRFFTNRLASATTARHSRRNARTSARKRRISRVNLPWRSALRLPKGAPPRPGEEVLQKFEFNPAGVSVRL